MQSVLMMSDNKDMKINSMKNIDAQLHVWTPTQGDKVTITTEKYEGIFSVKSYDSRTKLITIFVPDGLDEDGDTIYDIIKVPITQVKLSSKIY